MVNLKILNTCIICTLFIGYNNNDNNYDNDNNINNNNNNDNNINKNNNKMWDNMSLINLWHTT